MIVVKVNSTTSFCFMIIQLEGALLESLVDTLSAATVELAKCRKREQEMRAATEANELLNEAEAQAFLKRDANTLLYYRNKGLTCYKSGRDIWYKRGDLMAWVESGIVKRR